MLPAFGHDLDLELGGQAMENDPDQERRGRPKKPATMRNLPTTMIKRAPILGMGLAILVCPGLSAVDSGLREAWEQVANYSGAEAVDRFAAATLSPERQLGLATALLGRYPQTVQNVDRAEELLRAVLAGGSNAETRCGSLYVLARIEHLFRDNHDQQAAQYYRQLLGEFPASRLADNAAVKLALLELAALPKEASPVDVRARIARLDQPRRLASQSDFHLVVAEFLLERDDLEAALEHLVTSRDLGTVRGKSRASLDVQVGRVASLLHRGELARVAYGRFLSEFPMDERNFMVREEVKKLAAKQVR